MTADPVSWKVVERGWRVVAADGTEVGHVHEIRGDADADIFSGVVVSRGLLHGRRYVPAEQIGEIENGAVQLALDAGAFEQLPDAD